jgi:hypothetical protein
MLGSRCPWRWGGGGDELIGVGTCGGTKHRRAGADRLDAVVPCEEDGDRWQKNGGGCVRSHGLVNGLLNGPQRMGGKVSDVYSWTERHRPGLSIYIYIYSVTLPSRFVPTLSGGEGEREKRGIR